MKTTPVGGSERGYDEAKRMAGRKRHILVDTGDLASWRRASMAPLSPPGTAGGCWGKNRVYRG